MADGPCGERLIEKNREQGGRVYDQRSSSVLNLGFGFSLPRSATPMSERKSYFFVGRARSAASRTACLTASDLVLKPPVFITCRRSFSNSGVTFTLNCFIQPLYSSNTGLGCTCVYFG